MERHTLERLLRRPVDVVAVPGGWLIQYTCLPTGRPPVGTPQVRHMATGTNGRFGIPNRPNTSGFLVHHVAQRPRFTEQASFMAQRPMYQQIAEDLRARIESGTLEQGAQLPTELELRDRYASSRNTIRDAIKRLTMWGLVETRPGQGTFVTQQIHPFTFVLRGAGTEDDDLSELDVYVSRKESVGRYLAVTDTRVGIQGATEELATQLRITLGEPVISRQQMLTIDGVPWALQTIYYPMEFVTNGALRLIQAASIEEGTLAYLKESIGATQASWQDLIQCRQADNKEVEFMRLRSDGQALVFEVQRTGFDEEGKPMRLVVTAFPTDRNKFIYEVGPFATKKSK